jgi:hypothetical protein
VRLFVVVLKLNCAIEAIGSAGERVDCVVNIAAGLVEGIHLADEAAAGIVAEGGAVVDWIRYCYDVVS